MMCRKSGMNEAEIIRLYKKGAVQGGAFCE